MKHNRAMLRRVLSFAVVILLLMLVATGQIHVPVDNAATPTKSTLSPDILNSIVASSSAAYAVVRVVDGDTFVARIHGQDVTIRLIGINTPEIVDPRRPVECFGREASEMAEKKLAGQSITLALDPSQSAYDTYGRLLAYVYLPNHTLFNKMMIEEGYAYEYTYNIPYQYQTAFKAAENDARIHERGLWSPETCNGETDA